MFTDTAGNAARWFGCWWHYPALFLLSAGLAVMLASKKLNIKFNNNKVNGDFYFRFAGWASVFIGAVLSII